MIFNQLITIDEFQEYLCSPDTTLEEVFRRIDGSTQLFQIVTDPSGKILGTVTDGDLRRAILRGALLLDPVTCAMHREPVTGKIGDEEFNRSMMTKIGSTRSFLPILNVDGIVRSIVVYTSQQNFGTALVMAGGLGTRLGARTKNTPKPLLEVGGQKILEHVLSSLENFGVRKIIVSTHYLADQIECFVKTRNNSGDIQLLRENGRLGTAGAIGLLGDLPTTEPLLVVNGDVISSIDYKALFDYHNKHSFDGTIAVAKHEVQIPFGVINLNSEGGFEEIIEKPTLSNFIAAGIYYLSGEYRTLVGKNKSLEMPDLLQLGQRAGLKTGIFPLHEYWTDVGNPHDLDAADKSAKTRLNQPPKK